jgi:hypothetical protein
MCQIRLDRHEAGSRLLVGKHDDGHGTADWLR